MNRSASTSAGKSIRSMRSVVGCTTRPAKTVVIDLVEGDPGAYDG
jgi:hypothetical protein